MDDDEPVAREGVDHLRLEALDRLGTRRDSAEDSRPTLAERAFETRLPPGRLVARAA